MVIDLAKLHAGSEFKEGKAIPRQEERSRRGIPRPRDMEEPGGSPMFYVKESKQVT